MTDIPNSVKIATDLFKGFGEDILCDYNGKTLFEAIPDVLLEHLHLSTHMNLFTTAEFAYDESHDIYIDSDFEEIKVSLLLFDEDEIETWGEGEQDTLPVKFFSPSYVGDRMYVQGGEKIIDVSKYYHDNGLADVILVCSYKRIDSESFNLSVGAVAPYGAMKAHLTKISPFPKEQYVPYPKMRLSFKFLEDWCVY